MSLRVVIVSMYLLGSFHCGADEPASPPSSKPLMGREPVTTHHEMTVGGGTLSYEAIAGSLSLCDDKGEVQAEIFFVAYVKDDPSRRAERPITFAFNGGPGSSSVWLHLGGIGPKRIPCPQVNDHPLPPYHWIDNPDTPLDVTDLVFIDPVGTGFSRATSPESEKAFFNSEKDIEEVGKFIRNYLTRFDRWLSPKYLLGESYGTARAAGLSDYLQNSLNIALNGIVLFSLDLDLEQLLFTPSNALSQVIYLPSFAAAAWYHKKLPTTPYPSLQEVVREATQFAYHDYLCALYQGDALSPDQTKTIASQLVKLTGLTEEIILQNNLRIDPDLFFQKLYPNEMICIGRMDSRFTGWYAADLPSQDPSEICIAGAAAATLSAYLTEELHFNAGSQPYRVLNDDATQQWDFASPYTSPTTMPNLRSAMLYNPGLRVMMVGGFFDLATPFSTTFYSKHQLLLPKPLQRNVTIRLYPCGHMPYLDATSSSKLHADLVEFYTQKTQEVVSPSTQ